MKRILVVDDEKAICTMLRNALTTEYIVDVTYDGLEAMASIIENKPDVVIIDFNMNMPALHGMSVIEHILERPENETIKFILISGYLSEEQLIRWKQMCEDSVFFKKPFDIMELKEAVKAFVGE